MNELNETAPEQCVLALVGNKLDTGNKQVTMQEGQGFARKNNIKLVMEASAKTGENVDNLFQKISVACHQNKANFPTRMRETFKLARNDVEAEKVGGKKKKGCC